MTRRKHVTYIVSNDTGRRMTEHSRPFHDLADPTPDSGVDPRVERSLAAVVDASAQLLLDQGPDAITHARVANAAGVSRTTVYRYYPERSDLLRATIEVIRKARPDSSVFVDDLRADLQMLITMLATDLRDESHCMLMLTMMARARHDEVVAHVRNSMMGDIESAFHQLLGSAIARGDLRADLDVGRAQAALAGSLIYTRLLADREIDDAFVEAVIDDFITTNAPA